MRISVALISFLIFLSTPAHGGEVELALSEPIKMIGDYNNASFSWEIGGNSYILHEDGLLQMKQSQRKIRLPLGQGMLGLGLDFVKGIRNDLILGYGTSNGEDGTSFVCRIGGDLRAVRWCKNIGNINQSFSVSDDSVWVGAVGFAARLNINNGTYIWRHDDLYKLENGTDSFIITCPISENETTVTFYGQDTNNRNNQQLKVERKSGSIIEITRIADNYACTSRRH
jgi:hypothetical protein